MSPVIATHVIVFLNVYHVHVCTCTLEKHVSRMLDRNLDITFTFIRIRDIKPINSKAHLKISMYKTYVA